MTVKLIVWFGVLTALALVLATCGERRGARASRTPAAQPAPAKPRHNAHEHRHGRHPHKRDGHHHHLHPHPHVDGPNGHHHPY